MKSNDTQSSPNISVISSNIPSSQNKITIVNDGVLAKIVVFEKEDLVDEEICKLLNVYKYTKMEIIKHFTRIDSVDRHHYTVYNILI